MTDSVTIYQNDFEPLKKIIQLNNYSNIFLVTGKESFTGSGASATLSPCLKSLKVTRFNQFSVNPFLDDVIKGIEIFRKAAPDVVIAVGGGSVIDMAKLINALAPRSNSEFESIIKYNSKSLTKNLPLIAIPTTAGSGSEATHFAVVYIDNTKYSLAHQHILPDYGIINPRMTDTLPPYVAASSGIDALSHAVESYWSVNATSKSKYYASEAIKMILPVIHEAVKGCNTTAKNSMALAAHYAGKAINISKTTSAHALSYPLTTTFKTAHGHAVGIMISKFFVIHSDNKDNNKELAQTMKELFDLFGCEDAFQCQKKWISLLTSIGLTSDLYQLGVKTDVQKKKIINEVNIERMMNNPVQLNPDEIFNVLSS